MVTIAVVPPGAANLASVLAAVSRAGVDPVLARDGAAIEAADALVLPGVGSFAAGADHLAGGGLAESTRARVRAARPTLAICLGLHLLAEGSDEAPDRRGLGVVAGRATRFPTGGGVRVPQLGWNTVEPESGCTLLEPGVAYFAHSYRLTEAPAGWACAWSDHGAPFLAAIERGGVLACQFHPELSGAWGQALLERWIASRVAWRAGTGAVSSITNGAGSC